MQKIERYGVIALLLLLVTIVAVAFWNEEAQEPAGEPLARQDPAPRLDPRPTAANRPNPTPRNPAAGAGAQPQGARTPANPAREETARNRIDAGAVPLDPAARTNPGSTPSPAAAPNPGGAGEGALRFASGTTPSGGGAPNPAPGILPQPVTPQPSTPARTQAEPERTASVPPRTDSGAAPTGRPNPTASAPREVRVEPGDSLARIALRHLGSEAHWSKLADYNGISDPRRLQVGQRLRLPPIEGLAAAPGTNAAPTAATPPSAPRPTPTGGKTRLYTVQRGEVLGQIAQRECGTVKAVPSIVALNPGLDPNRVAAGQQILLPVAEGQRPADTQVALSTPAATGRASSGAPAARKNVVH